MAVELTRCAKRKLTLGSHRSLWLIPSEVHLLQEQEVKDMMMSKLDLEEHRQARTQEAWARETNLNMM